jgi:hypothetical protein
MNKIKKQIIILQLMSLIIGGCGCEMKKEKIKQEPTLNEWQKEFLAEQGLPTEYSELNLTQQLSVDAIYEMIMYLEEKYGIGFEYTGYVRPQILEEEYMTAIPEGGNAKTDTVTVTREDDGTFTDDYPNIAVRPYYEQMITDYVKDYFGSDKIKVISSISTSINDFNNITEEKMKGDVSSSNKIFIDSSLCNDKEVHTFVSDLSIWLNENQLLGTNWIYLLNNKTSISNIDETNYKDYFDDNYVSISTGCSIQSDNRIQILN